MVTNNLGNLGSSAEVSTEEVIGSSLTEALARVTNANAQTGFVEEIINDGSVFDANKAVVKQEGKMNMKYCSFRK